MITAFPAEDYRKFSRQLCFWGDGALRFTNTPYKTKLCNHWQLQSLLLSTLVAGDGFEPSTFGL